MKTCSKCIYRRANKEIDPDKSDIAFYCKERPEFFNPFTTERCGKYRLSDETLFFGLKQLRKHFAEHPEELERIRKMANK